MAVSQDDAPRGEVAVVLWEPRFTSYAGENGAPVRRAASSESADLLADLVAQGVRTLAFVRSRRAAEQVAATTAGLLAEVDPTRAESWLLAELAAGRRIMGMGHRIYRVRDPRAAVLETAVRPLASPRLELARAVERAAAKILAERKPDRPLAANVEFYTAVLLDAVGLPREQFSPTFAVARIAGWSAHVLEQRRVGRLIRPASRYVGLPLSTSST